MLEPEGGGQPPGRSQAAQAALSTAPCCHPSYVQFCPDFSSPPAKPRTSHMGPCCATGSVAKTPQVAAFLAQKQGWQLEQAADS